MSDESELYAIGARAAEALEASTSAHRRHALRNRLGSIRNAAFFLSRRVEPAWIEAEPRLEQFLTLIDADVAASQELLTTLTTPEARPSPVNLAHCVISALRTFPTERAMPLAEQLPSVSIDAAFVDVAAAVRLVLDVVSTGSAVITVSAEPARITVESGVSADMDDDKRLGAARLVLQPWSGVVVLEAEHNRCQIEFRVETE